MTLTIESMRGVWRAQVDHRTELAETLEELLLQLAPDAPEEYVWHAAEVLGSILGAETVVMPVKDEEIPEGVLEAYFGSFDAGGMTKEQWDESLGQEKSLVDELLEERREEAARENESWQPTEAQQAYFEDERTEDAETFDPDTFPRGA